VNALVQTDRVSEVKGVFRDAAAFTPDERKAVVARFVTAMTVADKQTEAYPLVPDADAPSAFRLLTENLYFEYEPQGDAGQKRQEKNLAALKALVVLHAKKHPTDVWLAVADGRAKNADGDHAGAVVVLTAALSKVPHVNDYSKDYDSGYLALKVELLTAWYKTGKAVVALRELKPTDGVFRDLARRFTSDKDATGLDKLIDAREKLPDEFADRLYWRAEAARVGEKHAAAAKMYAEYLSGPRTHDTYDPHRWEAEENLIRCLLRAGDTKGAEKECREETPAVVRAAVKVACGKKAEAEELLRQVLQWGDWMRATVYTDPDLGPMLKTDPAFAAFRKDFPPPDAK
jgi:hypothetical protein